MKIFIPQHIYGSDTKEVDITVRNEVVNLHSRVSSPNLTHILYS